MALVINDNLGKYLGWGALIFSAVFAADLTASGIERTLQETPEAVEIAAAPPAAKADGSISLNNLLREDESTPPPPPPEELNRKFPSASPVPGAESDEEEVPPDKSLEGAVLRGTMVTGGYRAALLEQEGEPKIIIEGEIIGDYRLQNVASTWVYFAPRKKRHTGVRLVLDTVVEPEMPEEEAEPIVKNGANDDQDKPDKNSDEEEIVKEKLSLDDIRAALNDTSKISTQVRVVPQSKDGQPYGTRLVFRTPKNIMAQLGLQNNDILLSVNGNPARSVEDMYQGYMTIRNAESLEFVVDRDGKETTVRYDLAK